jgi:SAM-dependent methyltransferase
MLARRDRLTSYREWNERWGAPAGRPRLPFPLAKRSIGRRHRGPFAWQSNSTTREFEFPWAYAELEKRSLRREIVEIGGGLAGLQFVLAKEGKSVTNVDPGLAAEGVGWDIRPGRHSKLAALFGPAKLIPTTLREAGIADESVDVVLSVSVIEHLTDAEILEVASDIRRILRPGGALVMTADLFLDIAPFTSVEKNRWGRNIDLRAFLARADLELTVGTRSELFGHPEFEPEGVLRALPEFVLSTKYPCLSQCLVAEKPAGAASSPQ